LEIEKENLRKGNKKRRGRRADCITWHRRKKQKELGEEKKMEGGKRMTKEKKSRALPARELEEKTGEFPPRGSGSKRKEFLIARAPDFVVVWDP